MIKLSLVLVSVFRVGENNPAVFYFPYLVDQEKRDCSCHAGVKSGSIETENRKLKGFCIACNSLFLITKFCKLT